jgi:hypothetical protein
MCVLPISGGPHLSVLDHPMTQGKIERWHQTLKNRILLENYYLPGDLEAQMMSLRPTTTTAATTRASVI